MALNFLVLILVGGGWGEEELAEGHWFIKDV